MTYTNIIEELFAKFPLLEQRYFDEGDYIWGLPYLCYALVFVPYIREVVEENDIEVITHICDFLEEMAISEDDQVSNLMAVGVLEDILSERSLVARLKKYLKAKTNDWLLSLEKAYGWDSEKKDT